MRGVTGITVEIFNGDIVLNWTVVSTTGLDHFLIYSSSTPEFTFSLSEIVFNSTDEVSPRATTWADTISLGDGNDQFWVVKAVDASWNIESSSSLMGGKIARSMGVGWGMVSLPLAQSYSDTWKVLTSIDGQYSGTRSFDPNTDTWTTDPESLDNSEALWVYMDSAVELDLVGTFATTTDQDLRVGWNFVSYPSVTTRTLDDALTGIDWDRAYRLNDGATSGEYHDVSKESHMNSLSSMDPGYSYWVHVNTPGTWSVEGV